MNKILRIFIILLLSLLFIITLMWTFDKFSNKGYVKVGYDYNNKIMYVDNFMYDFEIVDDLDGFEKDYMTVYYYDEVTNTYSLLGGRTRTKVYHKDGIYYVYIGDITNDELEISSTN